MTRRTIILTFILPISLALWLKLVSFDSLTNILSRFNLEQISNNDRDVNLLPLHLSLHRNGESVACFQQFVHINVEREIFGLVKQQNQGLDASRPLSKYQLDSFLTLLFTTLLPAQVCGDDTTTNPSKPAFLHFCDPGPYKTPLLPDHQHLLPVPNHNTWPCHFHFNNGLRITSLEQIQSIDSVLELYAVPAGRLFIFAPSYVGQEFNLTHVTGVDSEKPIVLSTLSLHPLILDIHNFFHSQEAIRIIQRALMETSESHRIKRSTTTAIPINNKRTSENGFDTVGHEALLLKMRSFQVLGFDEYYENMADGLQILRYNRSTAYFPHYDYIDDMPGQMHDYNSQGVGSNRFATILLYMSDMQDTDGGQTVFMEANHESTVTEESTAQALEELRASDIASFIQKDSWEEQMIIDCRTHLSITPKIGRAVLFYSQLPNGALAVDSLHGACPVLNGEKWAANLWVWNAPRDGYPEAPRKRMSSTQRRVLS